MSSPVDRAPNLVRDDRGDGAVGRTPIKQHRRVGQQFLRGLDDPVVHRCVHQAVDPAVHQRATLPGLERNLASGRDQDEEVVRSGRRVLGTEDHLGGVGGREHQVRDHPDGLTSLQAKALRQTVRCAFSCSAAFLTLALVSAATRLPGESVRTCETVVMETPDSSAMSRIVDRRCIFVTSAQSFWHYDGYYFARGRWLSIVVERVHPDGGTGGSTVPGVGVHVACRVSHADRCPVMDRATVIS